MSNDKGMLTVEASVILPLLWMVIAMLIFCSVFLLEMAAVQSECMGVSTELTSTGGKMEKGWERQAKSRLKGRLSERVHMSAVKGCGIGADGERVSAFAVIEFPLPLKGIRRILGAGEWGLRCSSTASACQWEDVLRGGGYNGDY